MSAGSARSRTRRDSGRQWGGWTFCLGPEVSFFRNPSARHVLPADGRTLKPARPAAAPRYRVPPPPSHRPPKPARTRAPLRTGSPSPTLRGRCQPAAGNAGIHQHLEDRGLADLLAGRFPGPGQGGTRGCLPVCAGSRATRRPTERRLSEACGSRYPAKGRGGPGGRYDRDRPVGGIRVVMDDKAQLIELARLACCARGGPAPESRAVPPARRRPRGPRLFCPPLVR
jgi:hypothetical protein